MAKTFAGLIFFTCILMFIVEIIYAGGFAPLEQNKMIGPDSYSLAKLGSSYGWRLQKHYELYRLISPAFLHGGIIHLAMNMMFLVFIGVGCEQRWGWKKFSILFFLTAIGASMLSTCINPNQISVGASGALFGIMGAQLLDIIMHWTALDPQARRMQLLMQVVTIIIWLIFSFGATFVDAYAHLGGLICGAFLGLAFWAPDGASHPLVTKFGRPVGMGLMTLYLGLLLVLFFTGVVQTNQLFSPIY